MKDEADCPDFFGTMGKYSEKIKRNGTGYRRTDVLRHHEKYWKNVEEQEFIYKMNEAKSEK